MRYDADITGPEDDRVELVESFEEFLSNYYDNRDSGHSPLLEFAEGYPGDQHAFTFDYDDLYRYSPDLADDLFSSPELFLYCMEDALSRYDFPIDVDMTNATVRVGGLDSVPDRHTYDVGEYSSNQFGELVVLKGQVTKIAGTKGRLEEAAHECKGCERQGPFTIRFDESVKRDYQLVRIQRPPEKSQGTATEDIDVLLFEDDHVGELTAGDRVNMAAVLKPDMIDEEEGIFEPTAYATGIEFQQTDYEDIEVEPHIDRINEIAASADPYSKLIDSMIPSHMGHRQVRLALVLQMFGGVEKRNADGSTSRGNSHVLLIGDPGTDKTGMLQYATDLSPRSVYTSGKNASSAGLTCAAVQDDFGDGGWTIEGGALVEANKGLCAIDEFDKMDESDRNGVNEALSNGTISPSKAGITNVTLPANTTVLAAANPVYGRFDPYESIGEQIDLDPTLISRFDLIITLKDQPDVEYDSDLAAHLNDVAYEGGLRAAGREHELDNSDTTVDPEIDNEVMRAYIAHAKQTCTPVLSEGARDRFKEFYVNLRERGTDEDAPVPVTARKLEALHRLGEASARVRLSDTVTREDADRVIEIVLQSLQDIGVDPETGEYDADMVETGTSKAQRDRIKDVKQIIEDTAKEYEDGAPVDVVIEKANTNGINPEKAKREIEKLKDQGEAYEPNKDHLRSA